MDVFENGSGKQISASTLIRSKGCRILGVFCSNAGASSRVAICDAAASVASAGAGRVVSPFAPTAGTFHRIPLETATGLYISLSGSAQNVTIVSIPLPGAPL